MDVSGEEKENNRSFWRARGVRPRAIGKSRGAREGGDAVDPERVGALSLEDGLVDHLVGEDLVSSEHHRVDVPLTERVVTAPVVGDKRPMFPFPDGVEERQGMFGGRRCRDEHSDDNHRQKRFPEWRFASENQFSACLMESGKVMSATMMMCVLVGE